MNSLNKWWSSFSKQQQKERFPNISTVEALCKNSLISTAMTGLLEDDYWQKRYLAQYPVVPGEREAEWLDWAIGQSLALIPLSQPFASTALPASNDYELRSAPLAIPKYSSSQTWKNAFQWREELEQRWCHGTIQIRELHVPPHSSDKPVHPSNIPLTPYSTVENAKGLKGSQFFVKSSIYKRMKQINIMVKQRHSKLLPLVSATWGTAFELQGQHRLLIAPVANQYQSIGIPGLKKRHNKEADSTCHLIDIYLPQEWTKFSYIRQAAANSMYLAVIPRHFVNTTACICVWQAAKVDPCASLSVSQHAIIAGISTHWLVWTDISANHHDRFQLCVYYLRQTNGTNEDYDGTRLNYGHFPYRMRGQTLILSSTNTSLQVVRLWQEKSNEIQFSWHVVCFERNTNNGDVAISCTILFSNQFDIQPSLTTSFINCEKQNNRSKGKHIKRRTKLPTANKVMLLRGNNNQLVIYIRNHAINRRSWLALVDVSLTNKHVSVDTLTINNTKDVPMNHSSNGIVWQHYASYCTVDVIAERGVIIARSSDDKTLVLSLQNGNMIHSYTSIWPTMNTANSTFMIIGGLQCGIQIDQMDGGEYKIAKALTGELKCLLTANNNDNGQQMIRNTSKNSNYTPVYIVRIYCSSTHICLPIKPPHNLKWRLWAKAARKFEPSYEETYRNYNAGEEASQPNIRASINTNRQDCYRSRSSAELTQWAAQPRSVKEGRVGPRELLSSAIWKMRPQRRLPRYVFLDATCQPFEQNTLN
ncbi:hypothetical protein BDF19DRAFT_447795 [Syncephalis fuscata]|nr:hypothetical protein BDF19DRAFT_447795 [Syncephalis fuscata]